MTQTMTLPQITYRRTTAGEWVAFGPASAIGRGTVTVTKKSGQTESRTVVRTGKSFRVNGVEMVYGYLLDRDIDVTVDSGTYVRTTDIPRGRPSRRNNWAPRSCQACQDVEDMSDAMGCDRHRGNPRN